MNRTEKIMWLIGIPLVFAFDFFSYYFLPQHISFELLGRIEVLYFMIWLLRYEYLTYKEAH